MSLQAAGMDMGRLKRQYLPHVFSFTWPKPRGSCWRWCPDRDECRSPDTSNRGYVGLSCRPDVRRRNRFGWTDRIGPPWWASVLSIRLCMSIAGWIRTNWHPQSLSQVCGSSSYANSAASQSRWFGWRVCAGSPCVGSQSFRVFLPVLSVLFPGSAGYPEIRITCRKRYKTQCFREKKLAFFFQWSWSAGERHLSESSRDRQKQWDWFLWISQKAAHGFTESGHPSKQRCAGAVHALVEKYPSNMWQQIKK